MTDQSQVEAAREECKKRSDDYADGCHTEGYFGAIRQGLYDAIDRLAALASAAAAMTPEQTRDGIADWIETNIHHREFYTPDVVELIRSIEINPSVFLRGREAPAASEPVVLQNTSEVAWVIDIKTGRWIQARVPVCAAPQPQRAPALPTRT
jgi:hypothetical protein